MRLDPRHLNRLGERLCGSCGRLIAQYDVVARLDARTREKIGDIEHLCAGSVECLNEWTVRVQDFDESIKLDRWPAT